MIQKHSMEGKNIFFEQLFEEATFWSNHCVFNNRKIFLKKDVDPLSSD